MPLCPSCIGDHNEYHLDKGIRANYINIFDSLDEVQTLMYGSLVNLEDDKKRNVFLGLFLGRCFVFDTLFIRDNSLKNNPHKEFSL